MELRWIEIKHCCQTIALARTARDTDGVAGKAGLWASSLLLKRATRDILTELALFGLLAVLACRKRADFAQLAVLV